MSTVQSYTTELQSIQNLITRQSSIIASDDLHKLMSLQCEAFVQKLNTVAALDINGVDELTQIVQAGPWKDVHKQRLVLAFSTALINVPAAGKAKPAKRESQEITAFQNWAVQSEAEVLQAFCISFQPKINTAVQMMKRLGLILPSEASKGHIMEVLLAACPEWLRTQTPVSVRDEYVKLTGAIRTAFKNTRNPGPQGFIVQWPETPAELPLSQREIMFEDQTPVVVCNSAALTGAKEYLAMRGNSSKLKQQVQPSTAGGMAGGPMNNSMMMMFQQMHQCMMAAAGSHGGGSSSDDINLSFNGNANRPRQLQHQLQGQLHQPVQGQLALAAPPASGQLALSAPDLKHNVHGSTDSSVADSLGGHTPTQSPTKSDGQLSPAAQAKRFMDSLQGKIKDDDDDDDDADTVPKRKPAAKGNAKTKAKAKAKPAALVHAPAAGKKSDLTFKPKVDCEDSRKQYLFRSGIPVHAGGLPSVAFPYSAHGGKKGAETAAKQHFCDFKKSHKCA